MYPNLKLFILDDSVGARFALTRLFADRPGFTVVGSAGYGFGLDRMINHADPDVIIADLPTLHEASIILPGITILSTLRLPIVIFSRCGEAMARDAVAAGRPGSVGYVLKPRGEGAESIDAFSRLADPLIHQIKAVYKAVSGRELGAPPIHRPVSPSAVVAIGSSTGGPEALAQILPQFPADFPAAIVIVQHMPGDFTGRFAERLNKVSAIPVKEAEEGDEVQVGRILLARGDYHLVFRPEDRSGLTHAVATLNLDPPQWKLRPTVDKMMVSLAGIYGSRLWGVILTGMGQDGSMGMREIKAVGGHTIVQNRETSAVYGMAQEVVNRNLADAILPLEDIVPELVRNLGRAQ